VIVATLLDQAVRPANTC